MNDIILVSTEDLAFRMEVETLARTEMAKCHFLLRGEHVMQLVKNYHPFMLVIDLSTDGADWIFKYVSEIKMHQRDFPIVTFVASGQESQKLRAESMGCDHVFPKTVYSKKLPEVIRRYQR